MTKKIGDIKIELENTQITEYPSFIAAYEQDERTGVRKLVEKAKKALEKLEEEKERIYKMQEFERKYSDRAYICGIDEAGRGGEKILRFVK